MEKIKVSLHVQGNIYTEGDIKSHSLDHGVYYNVTLSDPRFDFSGATMVESDMHIDGTIDMHDYVITASGDVAAGVPTEKK